MKDPGKYPMLDLFLKMVQSGRPSHLVLQELKLEKWFSIHL